MTQGDLKKKLKSRMVILLIFKCKWAHGREVIEDIVKNYSKANKIFRGANYFRVLQQGSRFTRNKFIVK